MILGRLMGRSYAVGVLVVLSTVIVRSDPTQGGEAATGDRLPGRIFLAVPRPTDPRHGLLAVDPNDHTCATLYEESNFSMRIAPGGRWVSYARRDEQTQRSTTVALDLERNVKHVLRVDVAATTCWSADGRLLLDDNDEVADAKQPKTWRMNSDGSNPASLPLPATEQVWDWSADGQWVVTSSARTPDDALAPELLLRPIYVMRTDGTEARLIAPAGERSGLNRTTYSGGSTFKPRFSPDGARLLMIISTSRDRGEGQANDLDVKLWSVRRESEKRDLLFDGDEDGGYPQSAAWSPDGKTVAVILAVPRVKNERRGWKHRLVLVDAAGTNVREIPLAQPSMVKVLDWR